MWIVFTKTYSGPLGVFAEGTKMDLSEKAVKRLPRNSYKKTCPPWEERTDIAALEVRDAHVKAAGAAQLSEKLRKIADEAARYRDQLVKVATERQDKDGEAKQAAEDAVAAAEKAKTKSMSANEKKKYNKLLAKAHELVAVHNRASLESQKASGLLTASIADAGLKILDADAAQAEADQLAADAKDAAEAKAAADADKVKTEQESKEDGPENSEQTDAEVTDPQGSAEQSPAATSEEQDDQQSEG